MSGGLFQLVAYGAQDIYLTGNPEVTFFKTRYEAHTNFERVYHPKSLQDLCTDRLTGKQKTWIVDNYSSYPVIADTVLEPNKQLHNRLCRDIRQLSNSIQNFKGKNRVTNMLMCMNGIWYKFDRNTAEKARIRYRHYKQQHESKKKEKFIQQQLSQQHAIQHDREIRRQQAEQDCDLNFDDLFD